MSTEAFNRVALPCLLVVGALVCCALPLWWVWRHSGVFPIFANRDLFLAVGGQTRAEEEHLTAMHGERYCAYAARVGRFVPGVGRLSDPPQEARS